MYESLYNLRTKPFSLLSDSDFLYAGSTHRAVYSTLEYGLINQAAFMVLRRTGDRQDVAPPEAYCTAWGEAVDRSGHERALQH